MIVRWLAEALADIERIVRHISEENPRAASKVAREILLAGDSLSLFPYRGRIGLALGTRELVALWPYLIVYEIDDQADSVNVLRIWHGSQER